MMKYLIMATLFSLILVGCVDQKSRMASPSIAINTTDITVHANQELYFTGPNDSVFTLTTADNFETAQLRDHSNVVYALKRDIPGSGIRLTNDAGVFIHFKNFNGINEGTIEFVKDHPIQIKEFKH